MTIVLDASIAVHVSLTRRGFRLLPQDLVAPALMWSEAVSVLHEHRRRGEISDRLARRALGLILGAPVQRAEPAYEEAWAVADRLGWARTYDAEYVACAMANGPLLTLDERLRKGAARLVTTLSPADL